MTQHGYNDLQTLLETIEQKQEDGKIIARNADQICEIFFRAGRIIHAFDNEGAQGDLALYSLLNWPNDQTNLDWQAGLFTTPHTIDEQEETAWREAMQLLQARHKPKPATVAPHSPSPEIVAAWQSLQQPARYSNIPATTANYRHLLQSFADSHQSGALRLRSGQSAYFCLFYRGQPLGFYQSPAQPAQPQDLQELAVLPDGLLGNPAACFDVFLTSSAVAQTSAVAQIPTTDTLSTAEVGRIEQLVQAIIRLLSELTNPRRLTENLAATLRGGSSRHPLFRKLTLQQNAASGLPVLSLGAATTPPRQESLAALSALLKDLLEQYCQPIGPATFHTMVARAVNREEALQLQAIGLQLDFLEDITQTNPTEISTGNVTQELNPYDF